MQYIYLFHVVPCGFGRVGKIAKATICFVISVCLSVCLSIRLSSWNNSDPTGPILMKFVLEYF